MAGTSGINVVFLIASLFSLSSSKQVNVTLNETAFTSVVDEIYHGVAMDFSVFKIYGIRKDINITAPRLKNLLRSISPCYYRVGGTAANWAFFDLPLEPLKTLDLPRATRLTKLEFDNIVDLTRQTGNRLLFDLNAELRYGKVWNPSDAIRLLEYCKEKNYTNIDWELGNEPNHISPSNLSLSQVANDAKTFHTLIRYYSMYKKSKLVGPDVGWMGVDYIKTVANVSGQYLDAYTIHQYYFNGRGATVDNYTDPSQFIKLDKLFHKIRGVLKDVNNKNKAWWLGETSTGYNSGTKDIADRYVSGFLNLEKMGFSAAKNVSVLIRQTIFNGFYALLDFKTFTPFPDFWMTWTHHHLVGRGVFNVTWIVPEDDPHIRVYAQCAKNLLDYNNGSVVVFALNVNPNVTYSLNFNGTSLKGSIDAYVLTPGKGGLLSKDVLLNNKTLRLNGDEVPAFNMSSVSVSSIDVAPMTYGFYVFKEADNVLCKNFKG